MSQQSIAAVTYMQLLVPEVFAITAHSDLRHRDTIFFSFLIKQGLEFHIFLSTFLQSSYVHPLPPLQLSLVDYSLLENIDHIVKPKAKADSAILPI